MCPCYVFLIDISLESKKTGYLECICETILKIVIENIYQGEERTIIGLILYDTYPQYVLIGKKPQILTVSGHNSDIFLPVPLDNLLINIQDNIEDIIQTIYCIKNIEGNPVSNGLKKGLFACKILLENCGGKVFAFMCNSSSEAAHQKNLAFVASSDFFHLLAEEMNDDNICVDAFITSNAFCGLFTIGEISRITGGDVYYYQNFSEASKENLSRDMIKAISQGIG